MSFFHLQNLSSSIVHDTCPPWEATNKRPTLSNKEEFRDWCKAKSTKHYFYSGFEGLNQSARIGKENPPYRIYGVVADYDCRIGRTEAKAHLTKNALPELRPAWISATFSGGLRLVWEFEQPIFAHSPAATKALLSRLRLELRCAKLAPGLDDNFLKPDQYYELGTDWERFSDDRILTKVLQLWAYQAGSRVNWSVEGTEIPIDLIAAKVEELFPGRWPGDFIEGGRGPRFWDPSADNDTAAIVRSSGMQCFTGDRPFVPWGSIFGLSFTRGFEAERIATATDGIHFDNRHYWRKDEKGSWFPGTLETLQLHLRVKAGLSRETGKETASEVDKAVYHIQSANRVHAALPFVHQRKGLHREPDGLYLNTSNVSVCAPAEGPVAWGEDFPWLSKFFDGFFSSAHQLDFFFAWLQRFYKTAHEGDMQPGQAVFIAGKVKQGKTLIGTKIVGPMLGGAADATNYLLGRSHWNSSLLERAVWNVDDPEPGKDKQVHATYSAALKKHVANREFEYQQKYRDAGRVRWTGRAMITLNDDEVSMGMLPEMDMSIMDKIMLFRAADRRFDFTDAERHIQKELPFFCRWLLDWQAPEHTRGDARYGVKEYHELSMFEAAQERGHIYGFLELLEVFLVDWFIAEPKRLEWQGTSTQFYRELSLSMPELARKTNPTSLGKGFAALVRIGNPHIDVLPLRARGKCWILKRSMIGDLADEKTGTYP
jgi:hypothetical protein